MTVRVANLTQLKRESENQEDHDVTMAEASSKLDTTEQMTMEEMIKATQMRLPEMVPPNYPNRKTSASNDNCLRDIWHNNPNLLKVIKC